VSRCVGAEIIIVESITIDIANRSIRLEIGDEELTARLSNWQRPPRKITRGYLGLYARLASSAAEGAIMKIN